MYLSLVLRTLSFKQTPSISNLCQMGWTYGTKLRRMQGIQCYSSPITTIYVHNPVIYTTQLSVINRIATVQLDWIAVCNVFTRTIDGDVTIRATLAEAAT